MTDRSPMRRRTHAAGARRSWVAVCVVAVVVSAGTAAAQPVTGRGFVEPRMFWFPQDAPNDSTNAVVDFLAREEVFAKPAEWLRLAAGADVRLDSHDSVENDWRIDFSDRTVHRPRISVRRLGATVARGWLTADVGKQFVRWGTTDIVNPTDHFAPRDFLDVVDNDFLGVTAVRAVAAVRGNSLDLVWVPRFTPSRIPLLNQRWTAVPAAAAGVPLVDVTPGYPTRPQVGVRWHHPGEAVEYSLSYFDGNNHLPDIRPSLGPLPITPDVSRSLEALGFGSPVRLQIARVYPAIRSYGSDVALPTRWFTLKGEAAYTTSSTPGTDEYVLYVVQVERQTGEWMLVGGYIGESVTRRRAALTFAPDRGLARSVAGRASYTIDANRSVAFETAVKQDARGVWLKSEYSQARGNHWRITLTGAVIAGHGDDFLGQYRRNSHVLLAARYSF